MEAPAFPEEALAAACAAAKAHLRLGDGGEDALVTRHVETALALCEAFTGQALIVRAWNATLPALRGWQRLPVGPVTAITAVDGLAAMGVATPLAVGSYAIDIDASGDGWVRMTQPGAVGRMRVGYAAGTAASWDRLPAPIRQGVVLLSAHLFEARAVGGAPPAAVAALWRAWRRMPLNTARVPA